MSGKVQNSGFSDHISDGEGTLTDKVHSRGPCVELHLLVIAGPPEKAAQHPASGARLIARNSAGRGFSRPNVRRRIPSVCEAADISVKHRFVVHDGRSRRVRHINHLCPQAPDPGLQTKTVGRYSLYWRVVDSRTRPADPLIVNQWRTSHKPNSRTPVSLRTKPRAPVLRSCQLERARKAQFPLD
jgi:hypothetical protein